ncbi:MAG: polysaccharide deacetylase family protein [Paludibacter sp.]|nr:polysaccharide deacetylase family protein [Paludibacter sp.]
MSLFCLSVPSAQSVDYTFYLEDINIPGHNKMVLLDYDFEKDIVGDYPYMGMIGTNQANLTCTVAEVEGRGNALFLNKTSHLDYWAKLTIALGQAYTTGNLTFGFWFYDVTIDSNAHGFQINMGPTSNTLSPHVLQFVHWNESYDRLVFAGQSVYIDESQWHYYEINYNWDNMLASVYVDYFLRIQTPLLATGVGFLNFAIPDYLADIATAYFDDITLYTDTPDVCPIRTPNGEVYTSIMFDDGNVHDLTVAKQIMGDLPGSSNIITGRVGQVGRLTWGNIEYLHSKGWDIWSHSVYHSYMPDNSTYPELQRLEIDESKRAIEENTTFSPEGFVYPSNARNDTLDFMVWDSYKYAATYYDGVSRLDNDVANFTFGLNDAPRYGVFRLARFLPTILYGSNNYVINYFHAIIDADNVLYGCNQSAFEWYIDILKDNNINVVAPSDILEYSRNAQNAMITGNAETFTVSLPTTYGNYSNSERIILSVLVDDFRVKYVVKDDNGKSYNYDLDESTGRLTFTGIVEGLQTVFHVGVFTPSKEYYSYIWVLIFLIPGIVLGLYAGKMGAIGGLIISTLIFGLTMSNGEFLLIIGLLSIFGMLANGGIDDEGGS